MSNHFAFIDDLIAISLHVALGDVEVSKDGWADLLMEAWLGFTETVTALGMHPQVYDADMDRLAALAGRKIGERHATAQFN